MPRRNLLLSLCAIFAAVLLAQYWLVGRQPVIKFKSAPALSGIVAEAMAGSNKGRVPLAGQDFNLANVRYFDSKQWVTADIQPVGNRFNSSLVVLHKLSDSYQVVLGPGSSFDSSYLFVLPTDVGQSLNSQGVFYGTSNQ